MHGSIVGWRCYGGNRFSADVDFYSNMGLSEEHQFKQGFLILLSSSGYDIVGERHSSLNRLLIDTRYVVPADKGDNVTSHTTTTLHLTIAHGNEQVIIDITFMTAVVKSAPANYTRIDGSNRVIHTLLPESLLKEKLDKYSYNYNVGKHKIEDLYDLVFLKERLGELSEVMRRDIALFVEKVDGNPPTNETELSGSMLDGRTPCFAELIGSLRNYTSII